MIVAARLSICGDCLQIVANGSAGLDLEPERIAEIEAAIAKQGGDVVPAGEEGEEGAFSWSPCELCESPLGGDRYAAALLVAEGVSP